MTIIQRLDPELAASLEKFPPFPDLQDIPAARRAFKALLERNPRRPDTQGVQISERRVPGSGSSPEVRVRLYRPETKRSRPLPALCYMHGGGCIMGTPEQDDDAVCRLVRDVGCLVASVDYRLAPEDPFPAGIEDCYSVLKWMAGNVRELDIDPRRIAVGGRSAGGGLAAALALLARDRAEIELSFQWLIYPMLDDRSATPGVSGITDERVWNHAHNRRAWSAYLGGEPGGPDTSPYAAAARARDLAGLPPAYIAVGAVEVFLEESADYACRLNLAGVPAELHVFPGAFHGWEAILPAAASSRRLIEERAAVLLRAFGG